jgi:hypothetical protein
MNPKLVWSTENIQEGNFFYNKIWGFAQPAVRVTRLANISPKWAIVDLGQLFVYYQNSPIFMLFPRKKYVFILTKKCYVEHFGLSFRKLICSPCQHSTRVTCLKSQFRQPYNSTLFSLSSFGYNMLLHS